MEHSNFMKSKIAPPSPLVEGEQGKRDFLLGKILYSIPLIRGTKGGLHSSPLEGWHAVTGWMYSRILFGDNSLYKGYLHTSI